MNSKLILQMTRGGRGVHCIACHAAAPGSNPANYSAAIQELFSFLGIGTKKNSQNYFQFFGLISRMSGY